MAYDEGETTLIYGAGIAGIGAGAWAGVKIGGLIGTFIGGPAGTAVGAGIGGIIGGAIGFFGGLFGAISTIDANNQEADQAAAATERTAHQKENILADFKAGIRTAYEDAMKQAAYIQEDADNARRFYTENYIDSMKGMDNSSKLQADAMATGRMQGASFLGKIAQTAGQSGARMSGTQKLNYTKTGDYITKKDQLDMQAYKLGNELNSNAVSREKTKGDQQVANSLNQRNDLLDRFKGIDTNNDGTLTDEELNEIVKNFKEDTAEGSWGEDNYSTWMNQQIQNVYGSWQTTNDTYKMAQSNSDYIKSNLLWSNLSGVANNSWNLIKIGYDFTKMNGG